MEINFELHFGLHKGFGVNRGQWRNQYGSGIFFELRAGIVRFEFSIERLLV